MVKSHQHQCPVAQMLNIFGDHWTLLIIREAFYGATRFTEFERRIGIAKNLLAQRLGLLCDEGVFEKQDVGERGARYAYFLTEKGTALQPVLIAMSQWGNKYCYSEEAAPISIAEKMTGNPIAPLQMISASGRFLSSRDVSVVPGPGANDATRQHLATAGGKRPARQPTKGI